MVGEVLISKLQVEWNHDPHLVWTIVLYTVHTPVCKCEVVHRNVSIAGWCTFRASATRTSVRQTLPSVGLCPEQAAVGALGRPGAQCCEGGLQLPGACRELLVGWGKSHSRSLWEAAGTEWGLVWLWQRDLASLSAWESPGQTEMSHMHHCVERVIPDHSISYLHGLTLQQGEVKRHPNEEGLTFETF